MFHFELLIFVATESARFSWWHSYKVHTMIVRTQLSWYNIVQTLAFNCTNIVRTEMYNFWQKKSEAEYWIVAKWRAQYLLELENDPFFLRIALGVHVRQGWITRVIVRGRRTIWWSRRPNALRVVYSVVHLKSSSAQFSSQVQYLVRSADDSWGSARCTGWFIWCPAYSIGRDKDESPERSQEALYNLNNFT